MKLRNGSRLQWLFDWIINYKSPWDSCTVNATTMWWTKWETNFVYAHNSLETLLQSKSLLTNSISQLFHIFFPFTIHKNFGGPAQNNMYMKIEWNEIKWKCIVTMQKFFVVGMPNFKQVQGKTFPTKLEFTTLTYKQNNNVQFSYFGIFNFLSSLYPCKHDKKLKNSA